MRTNENCSSAWRTCSLHVNKICFSYNSIIALFKSLIKPLDTSGRPIYRHGRYRPIFGIFQISPLADKFLCFADAFRGGTFILTALTEHIMLTFSITLNEYKKYYNDCFYIISNRKANIKIVSCLPSAFSKYAFISFKQIFEWLMNISFHKPCKLCRIQLWDLVKCAFVPCMIACYLHDGWSMRIECGHVETRDQQCHVIFTVCCM